MKSCVIYGAGTYGQVYAEYLKTEYKIVGFIDDTVRKGSIVGGYEVLGSKEDLLKLDKSNSIFVPIGNNVIRVRLLKEIELAGFSIPSFIHSTCTIHETVKIGKAVYVLPFSCVMPLSELRDYTMISMGVNIAHHVVIDEGCFFSQGVNVGASITFQRFAYCGIASTIMTGVKLIGTNSLIGAGAVVIKDVPENVKVVGNPARVIGKLI